LATRASTRAGTGGDCSLLLQSLAAQRIPAWSSKDTAMMQWCQTVT